MILPSQGIISRRDFLSIVVLLILSVIFRLYFWQQTNLTLEDALITFRYAENLAEGNGFVYNVGEKILGTTTPLWTLFLAVVKKVGVDNLFTASKILGIVFDLITLILLYLILRKISTGILPLLAAALFAASSEIIPVSVSGMETSLLLLCMTLALLGFTMKNSMFSLALALIILTRIDGVIFALCFIGYAFFVDRNWTVKQLAVTIVLLVPWFMFSYMYFGSFLPQSLLAKMAVYRFDLATSAMPFIGTFTPFNDEIGFKFVFKALVSLLLITGFIAILRKYRAPLPVAIFFLAYCLIFMSSRTLIFRWYVVPALFASLIIVAAGIDWMVERLHTMYRRISIASVIIPILVGGIAINVVFLHTRIEKYNQLQRLEEELRKEIGLWLKSTVKPRERAFLEPIGYIGYYAGLHVTILDEIGIVTPQVLHYRKLGAGWYEKALKELQPAYIVQYTYALEQNKSEGTNTTLFTDEAERTWFFNNYQIAKEFKVKNSYPLIEEKEKEYIILKA